MESNNNTNSNNNNNNNHLINQGKIGLNNRGNTCFLNTTIQCLSNVDRLTDYILENKFQVPFKYEQKKKELQNRLIKEFDIVRSFVQLIKVMWSSNESLDPKTFHISFQKYHNRFEGFNQQDAEEALTIVMDSLHEVFSYPVDIFITGDSENDLDRLMVESYQNWKKVTENKYSVITELFMGQFVNQIISREEEDRGKIISRTFEIFDRLNLPIHGNTLYDCLHSYFNIELLEDKYKDEVKSREVSVGRQIKLMILPKNLIIVLKRFQNNGMKLSKRNDNVSFPLEDLNLMNFTTGYDKNDAEYHLKCIGCHMGGINGGHYYAICRHRDGKWYIFNDRRCEEYNIRGEIEMLQQRAYMLIYEKKN